MTWVRKYRGDSTAPIAAEYECPEHGRFSITVRRDEVADALPCPVMVERYDGKFRSMIDRCGVDSPWRFPCPMTRVQRVTAARRGKDPERPPGVIDWQGLAYEEKSPQEWHAAERKKDWEDTRKIVKDALR